MKFELSVQDCFFNRSHSTETITNQFSSPISLHTWESWFDQWLGSLETDLPEAKSYELSLRLTDNSEIQALNSQYRKKNQPTDVLAFAALEVNSPKLSPQKQLSVPIYLGDIVISVDTAVQQAQQHGHSVSTELAWLATHGLLHLLGWDHPDEESLLRMLDQQETLLQSVGLSNYS
ncbi:MAG: rRNA maturation RNase YbeY [Moorea sp. SIOASIH]|uniref:rRNA maturation RNase YbeY n=1 Tax=Moorena sp. SIOASIH TaxID=2607817 RepID=UPI0013B61EDA|nr:rRNA maturation RNase YbeY [Moorena sp. SIOASIH]NEO37393.1 rRNA maturation RNase YbeY [Moorena sp. SIOASIH]